jgi:RimJ/RimL family protein N-acetyltransferase
MFDFQPRLAGDLLELRPVRAEDWTELFALGSDPEVWALHPERDRCTETKFRAYFDGGLASGGALVAICRKTGDIAGWSRFSSQFADPGEVEIGWTFLARAYWGGAYNTEMKRLMLGHAFRFVDRVIFRIGAHNLRSRRAVEKLGATLSARISPTVTGEPDPTHVVYVLERRDFAA